MEKLESLSLADINKTIDEAIKKIRCAKEKSSRFVPWSDKTDLEIAKTRIYLLQRQFSFSSKWGDKRFFFGLSNTNSQRCFYCFRVKYPGLPDAST